ncbi:MAG: DUF5103 domain-containing protein [Bacteroidia bacterium]|nr:DUF5103 domain-containing protein [Bacteroidia bacterium]
MRYPLLIILTLLCLHLEAQKKLQFIDMVYEPQIKTVQLLPDLSIEFDDLQDNRNDYYARLIHCNYDWTKSSLQDLDFLSEYNEFNLNEYSFSNNNYPVFVHYRFVIPTVNIPGNYLLVLYRDGDKNDLILTKRFFVVDNKVTLSKDNSIAGMGTLKTSNQQLNFILNYQRANIINPMESVHVVIRQNQRWDNARMDVKPSFVRESSKQLEYRFFDQDQHFTAGNEFRFVDFRSLNSPGENTGKIDRTVKPNRLTIQLDKSRGGQAYARYADANGRYEIENFDFGDAVTSANYVETIFSLLSNKIEGDVYVMGAFNNWIREDENRMAYNPGKGIYEAKILLKQGFYNYQYAVESKSLPSDYFEGSHFETENVYEVLVYYRPFQPNADLLLGYFVLPVNIY